MAMSKSALDFRSLSIPERLRLVEEIWDSIAQDAETLPLSPEQRAELDRRWAEHEADPATALPWDEVRDELYDRGG
jgi:putative addiction module component (TIGR02574 family)